MSAVPRALRCLAVLVMSLILLICTSAVSYKESMLRVSPSASLDAAELLAAGQMSVSGSVRVRYHGPRRFYQVATRVWKDGQWQAAMGATAPTSLPLDRRVSVALHEAGTSASDPQYRGIVADRADDQMQTIPFTIDKLDEQALGKMLELRSIVDAPDDEPVAVWGYAQYSDNPPPSSDEPIESQAERAAYAVIVTVQMLEHVAGG